jgi:Ser/Thr protein kinase RdoA (MazF antagonist)/predicted nucleotidyltransferase
MGVIKKILFRGDVLSRPRHRNMFLDMEENIHIHYRDLRLEMSRGEFEDFAAAFSQQSQELLGVIQEKNYQDGRLPNANQDEVRIWTESRLRHEIAYNPQGFSLEECGDGYHFHYRNCKILIEPEDFRALVQVIQELRLDSPYPATYGEVLELLEANEIDFVLAPGNVPDEVLAISVAKHHLRKVRDMFGYINFEQHSEAGLLRYTGPKLNVLFRAASEQAALDYRRMRALNTATRLVDHLHKKRSQLSPDELNRIKCQALEVYFALASGKTLHVETNPQFWLYAPGAGQVIFPYDQTPVGGKQVAEALYKAWSGLLGQLEMGFVKPTKQPFPPFVQKTLWNRIDDHLKSEIAAHAAVDRIYIMGSAARKDMGLYSAPFVHGKMVKLGSDVDILIEINPKREAEVPDSWRLINPKSSRHCAIYHIGQIPLAGDPGDWQTLHPHITFVHHLVDAYVFFPSQGRQAEKDAFLKKFGARLFYDRSRDGNIARGPLEERIAQAIAEQYSLELPVVERMKVSTRNDLFKVCAAEKNYILKLFKVSGNYNRSRIAEHTAYEQQLITQLKERGIPTAGVLQARDSNPAFEGFPALLFEHIPGNVQQRPEYPLETICAALARMHNVQLKQPLDLPVGFTFDDICMIWLPQYSIYADNSDHSPEIAAAFAGLTPLVDRCNPGENRAGLYEQSPFIHNHGDVTPKNVILTDQGEAIFFDFNNAFYGPRMADVIDGAFEFSLAEKYIHLADFSRFDPFIARYTENAPLTAGEERNLLRWIELVGVIKFTKEIRVMLEQPAEKLRKQRALAIAGFVLSRTGPASSQQT